MAGPGRRLPTPGPGRGEQSGSALLVVVGATAALAVMAQLLLLSSTTARAALSFQLDRLQAAELARAGLMQVDAGLRAGTLAVPAAGDPVDVTAVVSAIPSPPGSWSRGRAVAWPPATSAPPAAVDPLLGRGRRVVLGRVTDPYGVPRTMPVTTAAGDTVDAALLEVRALAWFRRATVELAGRFLVSETGLVVRLAPAPVGAP